MSHTSPTIVALSAFTNMFCVGTVYALSTLQDELPRLLPDISPARSLTPFAVACLGLAFGTQWSASLITSWGSNKAMAAGTAIWAAAMTFAGLSLQQASFSGILAALVIGGVGVGVTYLAVIVMVGQGVPDRPLTRSAIGPVGFSSGSAACVALSAYLQFAASDAPQLGQFLMRGGAISASVALLTVVLLPNGPFQVAKGRPPLEPQGSTDITGLSILLFTNAFPGMTAFSSLLTLARAHEVDSHIVIASCMTALTLGGLLAPYLYTMVGAKRTFAAIFGIRGLLLILLSRQGSTNSPALALISLLAVLLGHGAGFSVLPIVVKAKSSSLSSFYITYARILPAWGASGITGAIYQAIWILFTGDTQGGYLYIGVLATTASAAIAMLPWLL